MRRTGRARAIDFRVPISFQDRTLARPATGKSTRIAYILTRSRLRKKAETRLEFPKQPRSRFQDRTLAHPATGKSTRIALLNLESFPGLALAGVPVGSIAERFLNVGHRLRDRVHDMEELEILFADDSPLNKGLKVDNFIPVFTAEE